MIRIFDITSFQQRILELLGIGIDPKEEFMHVSSTKLFNLIKYRNSHF